MARRLIVLVLVVSAAAALVRRHGVDLLTRTTGTWIGAPDR
ncbi:MAG: hypothetical protein S0880_37905 [Actinomycetota bacterium]|nr:hypothetical protein [Actinomycetota bacterium]